MTRWLWLYSLLAGGIFFDWLGAGPALAARIRRSRYRRTR